ncbi:calphotin-like [Achroia grisella]|uniref:calphotin-like n=1 Tax=Achroia grisella TaxID=688607 RepID=UPI0027D33628|nr:calphotin-like [Achroia grisella]
MKLFVAVALIAAVASATSIRPVRPTLIPGELAEIQQIIEAINSPSTDPATAAALQELLLEYYNWEGSPISVGPVIIGNPEPEAISVGPEIVDPVIVNPSPVAVAESNSAPLVQIILNINQAESGAVGIPPSVALLPEIIGEPVQIVDSAPEAVQVVESPVQVVESPAVVAPVLVIDSAPVEPIIVATPIIPSFNIKMKIFVAVALIAAVASATYTRPVRPSPIPANISEIQQIIAAINSPSTDPATAAALQELLYEYYSWEGSPISVGPAIIGNPEPIAIGPEIVSPSPVPVSNVSPLVEIVLNINQAQPGAVSIPPGVAALPEIIQVVETPQVSPVQIGQTPTIAHPVLVAESALSPRSS